MGIRELREKYGRNKKGRDAGLAYLRSVVEDAKASGLVARAIERTGARGVSVAPAAT